MDMNASGTMVKSKSGFLKSLSHILISVSILSSFAISGLHKKLSVGSYVRDRLVRCWHCYQIIHGLDSALHHKYTHIEQWYGILDGTIA
jgi:hypothetical protein